MVNPVVPSYEEPAGIRTILKAADIGPEVPKDMFSVELSTKRLICYTVTTYFQTSLFCIEFESKTMWQNGHSKLVCVFEHLRTSGTLVEFDRPTADLA